MKHYAALLVALTLGAASAQCELPTETPTCHVDHCHGDGPCDA